MNKTEMIEAIMMMNNDQQNSFYDRLRESGMNEDDIRTIQSVVFFTKLFSDPELYKAVREEMGHQLYKQFTR